MFVFTVAKYDSNLNINNLRNFEVVAVYNTACFLRRNGSFLTFLSNTRSGIPDSINMEYPSFKKNFSIPERFTFDFSKSCAWNSEINVSCSIPENTAICQIEKIMQKGEVETLERMERLISKNKIEDIIGMGNGLTPSGDDFMVGALNTAAFFSNRLFKQLMTQITPVCENTTLLSSHFLKLALKRKAGEDVINLLRAVSVNNKIKIDNFAERVKNFGSSSGYYTLKGVVWALKKIL